MDGFFHISWSQAHSSLSFHFCFKFSSVFSYVSKILVSFISPRHPVKQSLKKRKDFRRRPPCGCSPPPQCVAPSCLRSEHLTPKSKSALIATRWQPLMLLVHSWNS